MTIIDYCMSLKMIIKILVVLGVVDMRQLLLKVSMRPVTPQFKNLSIADLKVQAPERHFSRPSVVHSGSKYSSLPP